MTMAGDGDGRYTNGKVLSVRLTTEETKALERLASSSNVSVSILVRELVNTIAAMPKQEQKKFLDQKVSAA